MKILFINAYFYPEEIAFSHLERDIISALLGAGNEIEVICPIPTRGISKDKAKEYKNIRSETVFGVRAVRFWAPQEGKNPIIRALRYFWCNLREYQIAKKRCGVDAVFAVSTPPTQGLLAGKIAKKLGCKFVYSLQDIFPDSMVNAGMMKKGSILWKIGRKIEDFSYRSADRIIVISEAFKKNIVEKGVPEDKIAVVPNWIDTDAVMPVDKKDNRLYSELKIDKNKFTVVYAGNFGASQGAGIVVKSAELLKEQENIQFVVFGAGSEYADVKEYVKNKCLKNIKTFDLLPAERVSEVYSLGDVAVITCKKGVGKSGMPSKMWSIMACDTPILASFDTDSELSSILKQTGAGICIEPENVSLLADTILKIYESNHKFPLNGRRYVFENASKEKCVKIYQEVIEGKLSVNADALSAG